MSRHFVNPIHVKLSQLREARGWTQAVLAERAGVTRATVSRIEGRKVASLNIKVFEKLADALDVDPTVLIDRSAEEEVTPRGPERRSGVERRTVDLVPSVQVNAIGAVGGSVGVGLIDGAQLMRRALTMPPSSLSREIKRRIYTGSPARR